MESSELPERGAYSKRAIRVLRLCLVAAVAIIGSIILWQLEPHRPAPIDVRVAEILGGAAAPFIVAVIPAVLIRRWFGLLIGLVIICVMDYFVAQGILAHAAH
jgi:hypothetical protein